MIGRSKRMSNPSAIEQAAARDWNEKQGYHRQQATRWFLFGVAGWACAVVAVTHASWFTETKIVPYVVERDHRGYTVATARLQASMPNISNIKGHMEIWVVSVRAVSSDAAVGQKRADQAYSWIDQSTVAKDQLDEWFFTNDPRVRVKTETVDVDVESVIPSDSVNTIQIDWKETAWDRQPGKPPRISRWRMIANIKIVTPTTDEEIKANWDGIFVQGFQVQNLSRGGV